MLKVCEVSGGKEGRDGRYWGGGEGMVTAHERGEGKQRISCHRQLVYLYLF